LTHTSGPLSHAIPPRPSLIFGFYELLAVDFTAGLVVFFDKEFLFLLNGSFLVNNGSVFIVGLPYNSLTVLGRFSH